MHLRENKDIDISNPELGADVFSRLVVKNPEMSAGLMSFSGYRWCLSVRS
jgi:hypothetical protein